MMSHSSFLKRRELSGGFFKRMLDKLGLHAPGGIRKSKLMLTGAHLYECCVEPVDHILFFRECDLPDTYNSWFVITELHVWMCMVRLMREGKEGKTVRNSLVELLWLDVDKRSRRIMTHIDRSAHIQSLHEHFQASLFGYDEGIMSNDKELAGAIWRHFYNMHQDDATKINLLVKFIRKNVHHLHLIDSHTLLTVGKVDWLPLVD